MDVFSLPFLALLLLALSLLVIFAAIARGAGISKPVRAAPMERDRHLR